MKSCSNTDGLVNYEVAYGVTPVMPNLQEGFMNADGGIDYENLGDVNDIYAINDDNFYAANGIDYENLGDVEDIYALNDDNYYAANGRRARRARRASARRETAGRVLGGVGSEVSKSLDAIRKRREMRVKGRMQAKVGEAEAKKLTAQAMGAGASSDAALAQALAGNTQPTQTGMSKNTKTLLIVGGVVVLGVVGFILYKKYRNKF